jgi:hypothetical protein
MTTELHVGLEFSSKVKVVGKLRENYSKEGP